MSEARAEVLARIRRALGPAVAVPEVRRDYRLRGDLDRDALLALLTDRLVDYKAAVRTATADDLVATLVTALAERIARVGGVGGGGGGGAGGGEAPGGAGIAAGPGSGSGGGGRFVVPPGLPWELPGAVVDADLTPAELDRLDGVVTACAVAVAETGTIVLDAGPDQGRRAITLVPDYHLCVVRADQVVQTVPEAIARLDPGRPLTWISGPSATSDIELHRVEGVHGPRTLEVVLVS